MVLTDFSNHPAVPGQNRIPFDEAATHQRTDMSIFSWEKTQELRAGNYTVWDHWFQKPSSNLEGKEHTIGSISVGQVNHKLKVGGNDQLEIYEYPGGYAHRFDGIDRNGQPKAEGVQTVFRESQRTVTIRMEQEEAAAIEIRGVCNCLNFVPGHKFSLEHHFDGDGEYLLTSAEHQARLGDNYLKGNESDFHYETQFICIPAALSYRPQRQTPKPVISGTQTAIVVGPAGEEIFCDKYGRVKVQFYWDREGKKNANSSCWLRVAQVWAGNGWGAFFWPRIGHEVVVTFEEGDPDRPLIIGSVYNAENMPWYSLPAKKQLAGFKSASVHGKAHEHFNGIVFDDAKGHEQLEIHSERHMSFNAEFDKVFHGGRHKGERVAVANVFTVGKLIPGGGGSGGGPRYRFTSLGTLGGGGSGGSPIVGKDMAVPKAQGLLGLNAQTVFGENIQTALGINHQLAVGSNYQVCINPLGLLSGLQVNPLVQGALGGGIGGNMQFTIGTSAQLTYGRAFEINVGAPKVELKSGTDVQDPVTYVLCLAITAAALLYVYAFGHFDNDDTRANLTILFQILLDGLFGACVYAEGKKRQVDQNAEEIRKDVFELNHETWTPGVSDKPGPPSPDFMTKPLADTGLYGLKEDLTASAFLLLPVVIGGVVLPLVVAGENEHSSDDDLPPQSQQGQ
jgi:type VI secretion system VgrG family protein